MIISGMHDPYLVFLSIVVAILASYTGLSLASRILTASGRFRPAWLVAASVSLGGGIWSMHFVAMLAFSMPGMQIRYDLALTLLSLLIAVAFTGGGFAVSHWTFIPRGRVAIAGLLMGLGVLAMHYLGMAAIQTGAVLTYEWVWLAFSLLIAVSAATAAVWLTSRNRAPSDRIVASVVMGCAIAGMHYAGMRAAVFTAGAAHPRVNGTGVDQANLALLVTALTLVIFLMALGAARVEQWLNDITRREARIALRLKVADVLRGNDTQQALEEVAQLLGQHFSVSRTGYALLDHDHGIFDYEVCWTDGSVPPLIGRYPAAAFGTKIVAALSAGETVAIEDLAAAALSDEARTRDTAREVDTRAILVVPFVREGRLRTIIYLNNRSPRSWNGQDIAFMQEIAERTRLVIERAAVEGELREFNATLEARVEARTQELRHAQEALFHSQKMEAMGQLVSGIAHDFNNVLGAVIGAFNLIHRRPTEPDRVTKFAEAGSQAAERGAQLIAQLLAFSRSQQLQLQPIYVCDVIAEMREMLARTLGPMIQLIFDLNPLPVPVMADPTQIEMTILNLAINARDAMMPDGGTVTIRTAVVNLANDQEIANGAYVEMSVQDSGEGMDTETLRRAMEPFYTTKPVGKGTGLGLAQIYGSARQAGGTARIESRVGVGTTVRVFLPCTDLLPVARSASDVSTQAAEITALDILFVDDDRSVRQIFASALRDAGHRVTEAEDGQAALAKLESLTPQIALLDYAMPGMNGAELAWELRRRRPDLPIVFATGHGDMAAIGAVAGEKALILHKPYSIDRLLQTLQNIFHPEQ